MDVLSASGIDDKIAWYENDGNQNFTAHVITTNADYANSVYAADIDGDNDLDVLSASLYDDKISWYENGPFNTINVTACNSFNSPSGTYMWNSSGTYLDTLPNLAGCDSIILINLTINNSNTGADTVSACDSFTSPSGLFIWDSTGTYYDTIPNVAGCDSNITINLTIINSSAGTDTVSACDSFTSPSGLYVWNSTGTYVDTMTNAAGCDSVITIDLTIINSSASTDTHTVCSSYTWIDSITYTSTNYTATYTFINAAGCDSVVTLNLTINNNTGTDTQTAALIKVYVAV